jgi:competence protein ComEC
MRPPTHSAFWKSAPLIRLLIPLIAGIIIQWYLQLILSYILLSISCFGIAFLLIYFFSPSAKYYLRKFQGGLIFLIIASVAMLLTWQKDRRHQNSWYGNFYTDSSVLLVKINEPLVEKSRSFKAEAIVKGIFNGQQYFAATGKLLIYFSKDSAAPALQYGQLILVKKQLQPIKNSGNPGAFNYQRYAAFQQLYHQLFLQTQDWIAMDKVYPNIFQSFLFNSRTFILNVMQQFIGNNHQELGIAEALLIGYKEDLDKDLVQAYSNAGVVHIIAISGLHLGLIYTVLFWFFNRLPWIKKSRHIKVILLLSSLWLFSLLTGGSASVLRSAVMFTVIVVGKYYFKQSSVYNSLSASAFILLCYNPYFLWDVGFQLSYLAVIGIVALQQPIYRSVYIKNKWVQKIWQMMTVTIAAQIAAFPICIYYFHQFPNMFLFTNLLVVPLSTIILFGEIFLVAVAAFATLATYTGLLLTWLVNLMNRIILFFDSFSFSLMDHIYANMYSTWLLYGIVAFLSGWLLNKNKTLLRFSLFCLVAFAALHGFARIQLYQQKKLVVYNISKHKAVDFIVGNQHVFAGDSVLNEEGLLQNFHLKPSRISMQVNEKVSQLPALKNHQFYWQFYNKKIIFIDSSFIFAPADSIIPIDLLLISNNPSIKIKDITKAVMPAIVVFDASNSLWKIDGWKKECEELLLPSYSVSEQGAFILEVQ